MKLTALLAALWAGAADATALEDVTVSGGRRGAFLANGMGARPVGMGEAYTAVANDASAVSWNPGGLTGVGGFGAVASYNALASGVGVSYLAGAMPLGPGTAGLGVAALNFGVVDQRDVNGATLGGASFLDFGVVAGWALRHATFMGKEGTTGVSVEVVKEAVGGTLVAVGAGGTYSLRPELAVAWAVAHLGTRAGGFGLPVVAKLGGAYALPSWGTLGLDVAYEPASRRAWVAVGGELTPLPLFALRAGYKTLAQAQGLEGVAGVTAGAGVRFGGFGLDYAYQPFGALTTAHRVSLTYGFGAPGRGPSFDAGREYAASVALYQVGDYGTALLKAQSVAAVDPGHWQAWQMIGNCRYARQDAAGALAAYRQSLGANPDNAQLKAFVDQLAAQPTAAAQPAAASPAGDAAYRESVTRYAAQDYDGAWAKAYEALQADPNRADAWQMIGNCQYAKGDRPGALDSYRRSLALNPSNVQLKAFVDSLGR